ncbi:MAG: glycosyltransferase family 2 protein [Deltaproteobacteria bacterium]|nr:MAG: glycosyltransferase family 2 protein [Deltaproteobacteria bacterium]
MPWVSIIIPTYNRRDFLREAIRSVLEQSFRDFELIVVDDGSDDGTREMIQREFPGLLTYLYQENQGVSRARNRGLELAQGEFVAFLDSDDLWLPRKLERQMAFMQSQPKAQICYTDEIWIRRGVRVNPKKKHAKYSGWIYPRCLPLCIISPSSALMRRGLLEEVGGFDEELPVCEDYDLWLRISARHPIHFLPEKLIVKRGGHQDQLSRRWGNDIWRVKALLKMLKDPSLRPDWRRMTVEELHRKGSILIKGFRKRGKEEEVKYYERILEQYPLEEG